MPVDTAQMREFELEATESALQRCAGAEACALCDTPPAELTSSEQTILAWLREHGTRHAPPAALFAPEPNGDDDPSRRDTHTFERVSERGRSTLWDSRLEPTLPIPETRLQVLVPQLSHEQRSLLEEEFVWPICGFCAAELERDDSDVVLEAAYVRFRFDGNRLAAQAQPVWPAALELLELLDRTTRLRNAG